MHAKNVVGTSVGVVLVTVIGAVVWASAATGTAQRRSGSTVPQVPKPAAAAIPGTDPGIQQWFLRIGQARVAFNNVLLKAESDIRTGATTGNCSSLLTATSLIKSRFAGLSAIPGGSGIVAAYLVPMDEFATAATACKNGDFATARATLGDTTRGAIADYGAAQDKVDEILDAGA